ncbi:MAG: hypothetical protein K8T25_02855 [Planctomycetia bacterium]|nr:hypothetical protein [Planctomycetia bacterium]
MASPFTHFRKYQAVLLVVFGVLIMFMFVIGDSINKLSSSKANNEDPVAVSWTGGKITRAHLQSLVGMRTVAAGFLRQLQFTGMMRGASDRPPRQQGLILTEQDLSGEATLQTILLATKAKQLGLTCTPDELKSYLRSLGSDQVSEDEMRVMIEGTAETRKQHSVDAVLAPIREALLARRLLEFVHGGLEGSPPANQYAYYTRLNQHVQTEIVALPVDDFLGQIQDPPEAELKAYFDEHKNELPSYDGKLSSPQPGLKLPHRVAVQYIKANVEDFVDRNMSKVTDQEIDKYYKEHQQDDPQLWQEDLPLLPPVDKTSPGKPAPKGDVEKSDDKKPIDRYPDHKKEGDLKDADKADKKDADKKDGGTGEKKEADKPAADSKSEPGKDADKDKADKKLSDKKDNSKAASDKSSSGEKPPGKTKDAPKKSATPTPSLTGETDQLAQADTAATKDPPAEAAPAAAKEADAVKTETEPASEKTPPVNGPASKSGEKSAAAEAPVKAPMPPAKTPPAAANPVGTLPELKLPPELKPREQHKIKPLTEAKDYIRKKLARDKAAEAIDAGFKTIEDRLAAYEVLLLEVAGEKGRKPPQPPEFKDLAKKLGFTAHQTPLLSRRQLFDETDVAKSGSRETGMSLLDMLFSDKGESTLRRPISTVDMKDNVRYLAWKTEDADETVPELKGEVRERAIKLWKRGAGLESAEGKARALAIAAAEKLAEGARKGEPIAEAAKSIPGAKVITPPEFSWLSGSTALDPAMRQSQPPQLSEIDGIDEPGTDFMKTVFSLSDGEVGVALNHPQTTVYVVKVLKHDWSSTALFDRFMVDMSTKQATMNYQLGQSTSLKWQELALRLYKDLLREYAVTWEIPEAKGSR